MDETLAQTISCELSYVETLAEFMTEHSDSLEGNQQQIEALSHAIAVMARRISDTVDRHIAAATVEHKATDRRQS
jgi:hypothetical protein